MKIKTALQAAGLKKVYDYIDKDPPCAAATGGLAD